MEPLTVLLIILLLLALAGFGFPRGRDFGGVLGTVVAILLIVLVLRLLGVL